MIACYRFGYSAYRPIEIYTCLSVCIAVRVFELQSNPTRIAFAFHRAVSWHSFWAVFLYSCCLGLAACAAPFFASVSQSELTFCARQFVFGHVLIPDALIVTNVANKFGRLLLLPDNLFIVCTL